MLNSRINPPQIQGSNNYDLDGSHHHEPHRYPNSIAFHYNCHDISAERLPSVKSCIMGESDDLHDDDLGNKDNAQSDNSRDEFSRESLL